MVVQTPSSVMLLLVGIAAMSVPCAAIPNGVAITPPMGFNTYMSPESGAIGMMKIAKFFVDSGLKNSGYVYINSDEGWEGKERDNTTHRIVPNPDFGDMKSFSDKLHQMGLKLGLYGAASGVTCGQNPGELYYEDIDAQTLADWGVDYIKSDNCASYALDSSVRFGAFRDALNRTGKALVYSIEPFSINPDPEQSVKVSNLWRIYVDIGRSYADVLNRADVCDKWAPLAGPGGWNDPDMIQIRPGDTLGQSRTYFGLWAIMKSPLLLSCDITTFDAALLGIVNNTDVIAINQDSLGVQARKLSVAGSTLPWHVGLSSCSGRPDTFYSRAFNATGSNDNRQWTLLETTAGDASVYAIKNEATNRCLTAEFNVTTGASAVVLLPCAVTSAEQQWVFDKGVHTVTSITNVAAKLALAVSNSTLFAKVHDKDDFPVSDVAYGDCGMLLVTPYDQRDCTTRDCQNYDPSQMWYYSASDGLLRQSTYTASVNHRADGDGRGYTLTQKVPTWQHHCLAHVLSVDNLGTFSGDTEVWGGPLSDGDMVMAFVNRGPTDADITATFSMLEMPGISASSSFTVKELWTGVDLGTKTAGFAFTVGATDMAIFRLSK
eukprot:m.591613 g.591613  ORF g.591613 m.591613 type:complete len:604 (+) comp22381_c0_seq4:1780-3591(+)